MVYRKAFPVLIAAAGILFGTYALEFRPSFQPGTFAQKAYLFPNSELAVVVLKNQAYEVGYSEVLKDPLWVHYTLNSRDATGANQTRPKDGFQEDPRTQAKITSRDYVGTGFDRGHMAPSYALGKFHGHNTQVETFVMSNVVPQTHFCNDGVWNSLKRMEADDFPARFGSVEVVDGPVFDSKPRRFACGVAIPSAFYKAIRRPDGQVLAFLIPQNPTSPKPEDYLVNLDEIEVKTGVVPFPDVPAASKALKRTKIW